MGCDLLSLFAYCPWAHGTTSSYCREKGRRGRFLTFNRRPPTIPLLLGRVIPILPPCTITLYLNTPMRLPLTPHTCDALQIHPTHPP